MEPRFDRVLKVWLSAELLATLDVLAARARRPRSEYVRLLLERHVEAARRRRAPPPGS